MQPKFPSLHVGNPYERSGVIIYPIFVAQLPLFEDSVPEPCWSVADSKQRQKVLACNRKIDGPKFPSLTNRGNAPLLFLPGDRITGTLLLNCSILVDHDSVVRIPDLCYTSAHRVHLGSPVVPPVNAVGWIACGFHKWELNLFGNKQACKKAGYRRLPRHDPGIATARDVKAFVNLIHRLPWQTIRSVGIGRSWVATLGRIHSEVLFFEKQLVHLRLIKTL